MTKTILLCEYGSTAHGTNTPDSDRDHMGIYIESVDAVLGLNNEDTRHSSTAAKGSRSAAADIDTTLYPLRKWATLAARGNPTVLTPLFVNEHISITDDGRTLLRERGLFITAEAGHRFLGYMRSQRDAMTGMRNKRTNRPELVHTHGYDTKFAYHMIRLGMLGIELMQTGRMVLPMSGGERATLMEIRAGKITKDEVLDYSRQLEGVLERAIETTDLAAHPNIRRINELLIELQVNAWAFQKR
jgi:predicted nucleotidyltransferase